MRCNAPPEMKPVLWFALAHSGVASIVRLSSSCQSAAVAHATQSSAGCSGLASTVGNETVFSACTGGAGCITSSLLSVDATIDTPPSYLCDLCSTGCTSAVADLVESALTVGTPLQSVCGSSQDAAALTLLREQSVATCNSLNAGDVAGSIDMSGLVDQCSECGMVRCTSGQFCPGGTELPRMCPEGYYCPTTVSKVKCPSGHYCPEGSSQPKECAKAAVCPEGAARPINLGFLIIMLVLLACMVVAIRFLEKRRLVAQDKQSAVGRKSRMGGHGDNNGSTSAAGSDARRPGVIIDFTDLRLVTRGVVRLAGVSGSIQPGRLTAILGGSGAGKTTLMNTLLGKEKATGGRVDITVVRPKDGQAGPSPAPSSLPAPGPDAQAYDNPMHKTAVVSPAPHASMAGGEDWEAVGTLPQAQLRYSLGFVPQTDVLLRELTVRETLLHAARTRLPSSTTAAEVERRVDETLSELGLVHVAHTLVGSAEEALAGGGLSGGERKRVSIGTELVSDPLVLVLDEPTTGLDATAALECMESVKSAAGRGLTCMAVIHQPRQEIVDLTDDIIVLGRGGRPVYSGPTALLMPYFRALGYACPADTNPVDFVLDAVNGKHGMPCDKAKGADGAMPGQAFVQAKHAAAGVASATDNNSNNNEGFADFTAAWTGGGEEWVRAQAGGRTTVLAQQEGKEGQAKAGRVSTGVGARPGLLPSIWLYFRRACLQKVRSSSLLLDCVAMLAGGCLMGIVCSGGPLFVPPVPSQYAHMCPPGADAFCRWARRYFIAPAGFYISMVAGSLSVPPAVRAFGTEREVFYREAGVGGNRTAYFIGKLMAEMPVYVLLAASFSAPLVAIAAWRAPPEMILATVLMLIAVVTAIAHCLAILMTSSDAASLVGVLIAILMNLFNGFVPRLGSGAVWSYTRWFERAIIAAELSHGFEMSDTAFNAIVQPEHEDPAWGKDLAILLAFWAIVNMLAGLLLLGTHRDKQR